MAGPFGRFGALLDIPGARPQSVFGLLGRAPASMLSVGFVAAAATAGPGGYALGGLAAGAFALGSAAGGPLFGRLADRRGQREVGRPLALVSAAAALLAVVSLLAVGATPLLVVLAGAAGLTQPNVGAFARVRWAALLDRHDEATTAQALESVIDEATFLVGPAAVALLAGVAFDGFPIALSAVFLIIGAFGITSSLVLPAPPSHAPEAASASGRARRPEFPAGLGLLAAVLVLGAALGAVQVLQFAYCQALALENGAALVYVVNSGASLIGALVVGALAFRTPARRRFTLALFGYAIGLVPTALVNGYLPFVVASVVSGIAIAPTFVQANAVVGEETPPRIRTASFAVLGSATVLGISVGSALAGQAVAAFGGDAARGILVPLAALCAVVAVLADLTHRRRVVDPQPDPAELAVEGHLAPAPIPPQLAPLAAHEHEHEHGHEHGHGAPDATRSVPDDRG
jgi:MFS family permease